MNHTKEYKQRIAAFNTACQLMAEHPDNPFLQDKCEGVLYRATNTLSKSNDTIIDFYSRYYDYE